MNSQLLHNGSLSAHSTSFVNSQSHSKQHVPQPNNGNHKMYINQYVLWVGDIPPVVTQKDKENLIKELQKFGECHSFKFPVSNSSYQQLFYNYKNEQSIDDAISQFKGIHLSSNGQFCPLKLVKHKNSQNSQLERVAEDEFDKIIFEYLRNRNSQFLSHLKQKYTISLTIPYDGLRKIYLEGKGYEVCEAFKELNAKIFELKHHGSLVGLLDRKTKQLIEKEIDKHHASLLSTRREWNNNKFEVVILSEQLEPLLQRIKQWEPSAAHSLVSIHKWCQTNSTHLVSMEPVHATIATSGDTSLSYVAAVATGNHIEKRNENLYSATVNSQGSTKNSSSNHNSTSTASFSKQNNYLISFDDEDDTDDDTDDDEEEDDFDSTKGKNGALLSKQYSAQDQVKVLNGKFLLRSIKHEILDLKKKKANNFNFRINKELKDLLIIVMGNNASAVASITEDVKKIKVHKRIVRIETEDKFLELQSVYKAQKLEIERTRIRFPKKKKDKVIANSLSEEKVENAAKVVREYLRTKATSISNSKSIALPSSEFFEVFAAMQQEGFLQKLGIPDLELLDHSVVIHFEDEKQLSLQQSLIHELNKNMVKLVANKVPANTNAIMNTLQSIKAQAVHAGELFLLLPLPPHREEFAIWITGKNVEAIHAMIEKLNHISTMRFSKATITSSKPASVKLYFDKSFFDFINSKNGKAKYEDERVEITWNPQNKPSCVVKGFPKNAVNVIVQLRKDEDAFLRHNTTIHCVKMKSSEMNYLKGSNYEELKDIERRVKGLKFLIDNTLIKVRNDFLEVELIHGDVFDTNASMLVLDTDHLRDRSKIVTVKSSKKKETKVTKEKQYDEVMEKFKQWHGREKVKNLGEVGKSTLIVMDKKLEDKVVLKSAVKDAIEIALKKERSTVAFSSQFVNSQSSHSKLILDTVLEAIRETITPMRIQFFSMDYSCLKKWREGIVNYAQQNTWYTEDYKSTANMHNLMESTSMEEYDNIDEEDLEEMSGSLLFFKCHKDYPQTVVREVKQLLSKYRLFRVVQVDSIPEEVLQEIQNRFPGIKTIRIGNRLELRGKEEELHGFRVEMIKSTIKHSLEVVNMNSRFRIADTEEENQVRNLFGNPNYEIFEVEKIDNAYLSTLYKKFSQYLHTKNNGAVNEKLLFHGTKEIDPTRVCKEGINSILCASEKWGKGLVFTESFEYANKFCHNVNGGREYKLVIAKVLLGLYKQVDRKERLKCLPALENDEFYDSISAETKGHKFYVLYDDFASIPVYIVTYVKKDSFLQMQSVQQNEVNSSSVGSGMDSVHSSPGSSIESITSPRNASVLAPSSSVSITSTPMHASSSVGPSPSSLLHHTMAAPLITSSPLAQALSYGESPPSVATGPFSIFMPSPPSLYATSALPSAFYGSPSHGGGFVNNPFVAPYPLFHSSSPNGSTLSGAATTSPNGAYFYETKQPSPSKFNMFLSGSPNNGAALSSTNSTFESFGVFNNAPSMSPKTPQK